MKKTSNIIIILVLFLVACEKEVKIPIEYTTPKLVINALFNTDSLWDVEISASRYIYDTNPIPLIDDAVVIILDSEGNNFELTNQGEGIYTSSTEKPQTGKTYSIEVNHDNYENARSTNKLPGEIIIDNIEWHEEVYVSGDLFRKINVTFQDSQEKDYYLIRMSGAFWEEIIDPLTGLSDSGLVIHPIYFFSQNAAVEEINSHSSQSSISFIDELFNGDQYTIDLLLYEFYFNNQPGWEVGLESIYISLSKISEEYYLYQKSYQKYQNSSGNTLFSQPTQVYTNIENGLGIFAGYSNSVDTINLR